MMELYDWNHEKDQLSNAHFTIQMVDYGRSSVYLRNGKPIEWKSSEECAIVDELLIGEHKAFEVSEQALHKDIQFFLCSFQRHFAHLFSKDELAVLIKRCDDYTEEYKLEKLMRFCLP